MKEYILAIDQGTTGTTAALFDTTGLKILASAKEEFPQIYPKPGWVEHDATAIWKSTLCAVEKVFDAENKRTNTNVKDRIAGIGITNQRETVLAWNKKTGELAGNALVWQDRRTAEFCNELKADEKRRKMLLQKTGLVCDPYFSASKMRWLLQNNDKAKVWAANGDLVFGTIDCYLIFKLTAGRTIATEHTNASRTMLYALERGDYDDELLAVFGVNKNALPEVRPSSGEFGLTKGVGVIPDGIPILGCLGDQQAALLGQNCTKKGEAKITFGTGAFLLMHTGEKAVHTDSGLLTTVAYSTSSARTFALEGAAFIAGAAVQFLRDNFGWFADSVQSEALAKQDARDENLVFVPAFAGLAAPYWNPHAKAALLGLTRGSSKSQITRAVLESIALQNVQLLNLMEEASQTKLLRVGVDGKAALNDMLMQFQADTVRAKLVRPANIETTAKGAAKAAQAHLLGRNDLPFQENVTEFVPRMIEGEATRIVKNWTRAAAALDAFYRV